jgi:Concanavalin A-like lectin/glucanases superfamily
VSSRSIAVLATLVGCGRIGFGTIGAGDSAPTDTGGDGVGEVRLEMLDCSPTVIEPPICSGLVALLHFDDDPTYGETATIAHDFSEHDNDATCTTCPTFVPGGGRFGGAFTYAEPQAFAIANGPSVSITGAVTMSAWFYPVTLATNWRIVITKIQQSPLVANYGLPHNGTELCVNFCTAGGGWMNHCSPGGYAPGRWYHLVGVIDNIGHRAQLYVDGALIVDDPEVANMEQDSGQVWIGWSPTNFGVDGLIDEVAIWNRALSPAEIAALY